MIMSTEVQAGFGWSSLSPAPYSALLPKFWPQVNSGQATSWLQKLRSSSYPETQILKAPSIELLHHGHPLGAEPCLSSQIAPKLPLSHPHQCFMKASLVLLQIVTLHLRNNGWLVTKPQKALNTDHGPEVLMPSEMSITNRLLCDP